MLRSQVRVGPRRLQIILTSIALCAMLTSCFQPIQQDILLIVADDFAPTLVVYSPQLNDIYTSTMSIVGNLVDSSQEPDDASGMLASITLDFLNATQYNRLVYFDYGSDGDELVLTWEPVDPNPSLRPTAQIEKNQGVHSGEASFWDLEGESSAF